MRGRIIHYNAADGRGLISADNRQYPFEISHWRSEMAPAVNAAVDLELQGDQTAGVSRVPDEVLFREKAGELAGRLGGLGAQALDGARRPGAVPAGSLVERLGKPTLVAQGAFAVGAMLLSFVTLKTGLGPTQNVTLAGLSKLSEMLGASAGSGPLVWLAILSVAVPLLWRHRVAWLALLLPLIAVLKPAWDIKRAISAAGAGMGDAYSNAIANQLAEMVSPGMGAYLCLASAIALAAIGAKRFLLHTA